MIIAFRATKWKPTRRGFTLIEILVVIAIIAILAAITLSVFARAKESGKKAACISNLNQTNVAMQLYLDDFDGAYPQTRKSSANMAVDDAAGQLEEPDFGSAFNRLVVYSKTRAVFTCLSDVDPTGKACDTTDPDHPDLDSYLYNGSFAFGLKESSVNRPAETILFAERRSVAVGSTPPYCLYMYRPWFSSANPQAPEDDMDPSSGAIATRRHDAHSVYSFTDGHAKVMVFSQTFDPSGRVDLHKP